MEAALNNHPRFRGAALKLLSDDALISNLDDWKKNLDKGSAEARAAIIRRMGSVKNPDVAQAILPYLDSDDSEVRMASIPALVTAGENLALDALLDRLETSSNTTETEALVTALKTMKGSQVTAAIAGRIQGASADKKTVLISILASRAAEDQIETVFEAAADNEPTVKEAALKALSEMATPQDLDRLVALLRAERSPDNLNKIQEAIIVANAQKGDQTAETRWAMDLLPQLPDNKQAYLYKVLAKTGGQEALEKLKGIYESGNAGRQQAVVTALNQADDPTATGALLDIARQANTDGLRESALMGFIRLVPTMEETDTQKY